MARIAWGGFPPEAGSMQRYAWLQESEISTFCRIKAVYIKGVGEEGFEELRKIIFTKLPGETPPLEATPGEGVEPETKLANETLSEQDIFNRSLFSVRCESF
jgi:hypothetical protein